MTDQELLDRRNRLELIGALTVQMRLTTDRADYQALHRARRDLIDLVLAERGDGQERQAA